MFISLIIVEPKFAPPSPILPSNSREIRRLSADSTTATGRSTLPMPDNPSLLPHVKRRYGTSSRPSTIDSRHLSWINGSSINKFPSGAQTEILKSFIATVDDEVSVPAGSMVSAMYKDTTGQWIYVKRGDGQHGYVPDFICSLLIPTPPLSDSPPPEKPKISRRKSQQIKRELKKFHKREYEKRAEQLLQQHHSAFTSESSSRLPNRFGSTIGHSARFLKTASMDRLQLKQAAANRRPSKNGIGSVTAATAAAICAVAADKNRRNYISPSGLVTLERAKPRRLPTAAERQFAMNENLRRFLSSLPEFPMPPDDHDIEDSDDRPLNDTTIEQDDEEDGGKSSGDARYARLKSTSQMNLTEKHDDDVDSDTSGLELAKKITIKMKSGKVTRQLSVSNPDFGANFGLKKTPPEPPPKPLKSAASVSRLQNNSGKTIQSHTVQRQRRALNSVPVHSTASLARPSCWRPAEPVIHELVAIQDFRAETKIDLYVRRGDRLTTVFSAINGWIWATHSDSKQQGFIPSSSVMLANEFS
uniref:SH3 domain-containing protein n=1 Tax=Panagrolaimus sp. ES5 TaxID=591445 RepID=A0AC34FTV2_9BILA